MLTHVKKRHGGIRIEQDNMYMRVIPSSSASRATLIQINRCASRIRQCSSQCSRTITKQTDGGLRGDNVSMQQQGAPLRQDVHPFSGFNYRALGDGIVRVENPKTHEHGLFKWDGTWLEGAITHADLHFLYYVGGSDLPPEKDIIWARLPLEIAPETPPEAFFWGRMPKELPRTVGQYNPAPHKMTDKGPRSAASIELAYFLDNDRKPEAIPDYYRLESPMPGGPDRVSAARFVDRRYHEREIERLWKRVWQMACRADEIPNVGDYHVYTVADLSWLIVRTGPNEFKAHQNVCMHRGRILREQSGTAAKEFRCPYHGWSWKVDGSMKEMTCEWDFPGVREEVSHLPSAKVATWGGWIFINPDPNAMSLEEFLGPVMMAHYTRFDLEGRYKQAHVTRPMAANWKITMEAFMEGWHVLATHPQLLLFGGDNGHDRFDVFGHWSRGGHVRCDSSSAQRNIFISREQALALYRAEADGARKYLRGILGDEVDKFADAELNDACYNDLFPNFHPWGGFSRINFRFRPMGDNHEKALMDVILLAPWPKDKPKPTPAPHRILTEEQSWCEAPELGTLARILDQDAGNMASMQAGAKALESGHIWYSTYNESKIRNFHRNYDRWLGLNENGEF